MAQAEAEGTYLDDYIASVELLPNDIRRDFELVRDLDREAIELTESMTALEQEYLERARTRKLGGQAIAVPSPQKISFTNCASGVSNGSVLMGSHPKGGSSDGVQTGGGSSLSSTQDKKGKDTEGIRLLNEINAIRERVNERLSQKSAIVRNMMSQLNKFQSKINTDLAFFETTLRSCGDFASAGGVLPGMDVAIRPNPQAPEDMILGRVIAYYADIGFYDVADVDDSKRYHLPEASVTVLDMVDNPKKLSKGDVVHAVYPDTTAFYTAIVSQAPRRGQTGMEPTVMVQFQGDADSDGQTPNRTILLKHTFRALVVT
jgi:hypothetical protein